jgi:hypothetical protein
MEGANVLLIHNSSSSEIEHCLTERESKRQGEGARESPPLTQRDAARSGEVMTAQKGKGAGISF